MNGTHFSKYNSSLFLHESSVAISAIVSFRILVSAFEKVYFILIVKKDIDRGICSVLKR